VSAQRPPRVRCRSGGTGTLRLVEGDNEAGDGRMLSGTFSVFNTWQQISDPSGLFTEKIAPTAFTKTIRERRADLGIILGPRQRSGFLQVQWRAALVRLKRSNYRFGAMEGPFRGRSDEEDTLLLVAALFADGQSQRASTTDWAQEPFQCPNPKESHANVGNPEDAGEKGRSTLSP
jgi:hypothetical protein